MQVTKWEPICNNATLESTSTSTADDNQNLTQKLSPMGSLLFTATAYSASQRLIYVHGGIAIQRNQLNASSTTHGLSHNGLHIYETGNGRWHNLTVGDGDFYNALPKQAAAVGSKRERSPARESFPSEVQNIDPLAADSDEDFIDEEDINSSPVLFFGNNREDSNIQDERQLRNNLKDETVNPSADNNFEAENEAIGVPKVKVKDEGGTFKNYSSKTHVYLASFGHQSPNLEGGGGSDASDIKFQSSPQSSQRVPISQGGIHVPIVGETSPSRHSHVAFFLNNETFVIHGGKYVFSTARAYNSTVTSDLFAFHIRSGLWERLGALVGGDEAPSMYGHSVIPISLSSSHTTSGADADVKLFCFIGPIGSSTSGPNEMAVYILSIDNAGHRQWKKILMGDSANNNTDNNNNKGERLPVGQRRSNGLKYPQRRYFTVALATSAQEIESSLVIRRPSSHHDASDQSRDPIDELVFNTGTSYSEPVATPAKSTLLCDFFLAGGVAGSHYLQDCYFFNSTSNTWTEIIDFSIPRGLYSHDGHGESSYSANKELLSASSEQRAIHSNVECTRVFSSRPAKIFRGAVSFFHTPRRQANHQYEGADSVTTDVSENLTTAFTPAPRGGVNLETSSDANAKKTRWLPVDGTLTFINKHEIVLIDIDSSFYELPPPQQLINRTTTNPEAQGIAKKNTWKRKDKVMKPDRKLSKHEQMLAALSKVSLESRLANRSLTAPSSSNGEQMSQTTSAQTSPLSLSRSALQRQVYRTSVPTFSSNSLGFCALYVDSHKDRHIPWVLETSGLGTTNNEPADTQHTLRPRVIESIDIEDNALGEQTHPSAHANEPKSQADMWLRFRLIAIANSDKKTPITAQVQINFCQRSPTPPPSPPPLPSLQLQSLPVGQNTTDTMPLIPRNAEQLVPTENNARETTFSKAIATGPSQNMLSFPSIPIEVGNNTTVADNSTMFEFD